VTGTRPAGLRPAVLRLSGRVLTGEQDLERGFVEVTGERVTDVGRLGPDDGIGGADTGGPGAGPTAPSWWHDGLVVIPGLVDVHCHGGAGGEFGPDLDGARLAVEHHRRHGTTTLVASLVSAVPDLLVEGMRTLAALTAAGELAGVHLEGPFLSTVRCGAQNPATLTDVDRGLVERLGAVAAQAGSPHAMAHMTFAPERGGAGALPAALADLGALAAVGHTDADARAVRTALAEAAQVAPRGGRPLVTHVFNGMPPMHHRSPGPVAAALAAAANGEAVLEVIADGVHLHPDTVRMLFDVVGPQNLCLVSDAMSASGMPPGRYQLGGLQVEVDGRAARLADNGSLAGGVATALDLVRVCVQDAGVSLADAVTAATATPAAALGLPTGRLVAGTTADLVVLDGDLALVAVLRGGQWVASPG
jgi:N-acetylglucosamine-6-phosphate deacetylase